MMGQQTGDQASLFYEFRLEDRIPKDHLLRRINVFVAPVLDSVREQLKPFYSELDGHRLTPSLCCGCSLSATAMACVLNAG
jgi:hypothetical protein